MFNFPKYLKNLDRVIIANSSGPIILILKKLLYKIVFLKKFTIFIFISPLKFTTSIPAKQIHKMFTNV